jgi:hypothetical protein
MSLKGGGEMKNQSTTAFLDAVQEEELATSIHMMTYIQAKYSMLRIPKDILERINSSILDMTRLV